MFFNYNHLVDLPKGEVGQFTIMREIAMLFGEFVIKQPLGSRPKYRCHSVCRALHILIPNLTVVDGFYFGIQKTRRNKAVGVKYRPYPHTWLITKKKTIFDPYPVGVASGPVLIMTKGMYAPYGSGPYYPCPMHKEKYDREHQKETEILVTLLREVIIKSKREHLLLPTKAE